MSRRAGAHTRAAQQPEARIGRAEAGRLLAGQPARDGWHRGLESLLAAAAAAPDREQSGRGLDAVLSAFAEAKAGVSPIARADAVARTGSSTVRTVTTATDASIVAGRPGRPRQPEPPAGRIRRKQFGLTAPRLSRALAVKCLALAAVMSGAGMAAAANVLPGPVQSIVYDVFGDLGVPPPAPSAGHPNPNAAPGPALGASPAQTPSATASAGPTGAPTTNAATPTPSPVTPLALCELAVRSLSTPGALDPADLARLSADAGGYPDIPKYCAEVLKSDPGGYSAPYHLPSPTAPVTTSPDQPVHTPGPTETTAAAHSPDPSPRSTHVKGAH